MALSRFDPWRSGLCTCPPKLTLNPYTGCDHGCLYCYAASYVSRFLDCRPKKDLLRKLNREAPRLSGDLVSMSNSSDPYPNLEVNSGLTRRCLEVLIKHDCRIQVVTKSNLVLRDVDLLKKGRSMIAMTITTDDDAVAEVIEPYAPRPSERMKAIERLVHEGLLVSVRIDPLIPYINDDPEELVKELASMGVKHITSSTYKVTFNNWKRIRRVMPMLSEKLEPLYFKIGERIGGQFLLPRALRLTLMENVRQVSNKHGLRFGTCREGLSHLNTCTCDGSWML